MSIIEMSSHDSTSLSVDCFAIEYGQQLRLVEGDYVEAGNKQCDENESEKRIKN